MGMNRAEVRSYYAGIGDALIRHATGRPVTVTAASGSILGVERILTTRDLDDVARRGGVSLSAALPDAPPMSPIRCALHVVAGEGTGISTAATAALALCESIARDHLTAVVITDGHDGLYVLGIAAGVAAGAGSPGPAPDGWLAASGYAEELARRAPEIATVDPRQADGRALVDASPSWPGNLIPIPYSLVPADPASGGGYGAVIPLDLDEVAAVTAGMPLDPRPLDVTGRLAARGDLAAGLLGPGGGPA